MPTTGIARAFDASGPFLSLYMATRGDVENAGQLVQLRWKNARSDLLEQGVPEGLLENVDPMVEGSQLAGATLAVIASVDGVLWSDNLPEPPAREVMARWAALPSLIPLLAHQQGLVPHVAVLASRAAAELAARTPDGDGHPPVKVEGERSPHLTRSAPGGWSQPRYQHRAEVTWERNAAEVAEVLTDMVDQVRPRFVAVAGDVRAVQFLRDKSPKRVRELLQVVGGELASVDEVLEEALRLVEATVERDTRALLDRFEEERGQHDLAVEGAAGTLAALARAQVDTLLVVDQPDDERTAWFGAGGQEVAADRETLLAAGQGTPAEGRLVDVAVRAALTTSATVRVLGRDERRAPSEGLGGLLRFATPERST
jgi:Bacterial archaeo-eukaryotic release factor family 2